MALTYQRRTNQELHRRRPFLDLERLLRPLPQLRHRDHPLHPDQQDRASAPLRVGSEELYQNGEDAARDQFHEGKILR